MNWVIVTTFLEDIFRGNLPEQVLSLLQQNVPGPLYWLIIAI
jgi:hypothetical protein